eukprot:TRINITY_DN22031_c0_g2_i1.p1 TRINITY_DN22031_c0_g2~~TRINITY_DN22031_c0_g2_i1.p1  ORF type:complete len:231 (+),score=7.10 TRINITY_DN22031_c0_g2_i1:64-693(+)
MGPGQYRSLAVSGHISYWTLEALEDFLRFFEVFFKHLPEEPITREYDKDKLPIAQIAYNDMVLLGWYSYAKCWETPPEKQKEKCVIFSDVETKEVHASRIRKEFTPRFTVDSLSAPRWCNDTDWSKKGWCTFDNNFSVQMNGSRTQQRLLHYNPAMGDLAPSTKHYMYYEAWLEGKQKESLQMLGVHFQGRQKHLIMEDAATSWGASPD